MVIDTDKLKSLYDNAEDKMPYFKRNTYDEAFHKYYGECLSTYDEINGILADKDETAAASVLEDVASDFVSVFKNEYDGLNKKGQKRSFVTNHNSPLVIFVFPGILEYKASWSEKLCQLITDKWNAAFTELTISFGTFEHIKGGFKTTLCYITTAVCLSLGKDDDCEELKLLRNYRDNVLMSEPDGEELVREYYDIAPTIVKRIEKTERPYDIYLSLYKDYIYKCIEHIKSKRFDMCKSTYISMVKELKADYAY